MFLFFGVFFLQTKKNGQHTQPHPERRCVAGQLKGTQRPVAMNTSVTKMEIRDNWRGSGGTCFLSSCCTHWDCGDWPLHKVFNRSSITDPAAYPYLDNCLSINVCNGMIFKFFLLLFSLSWSRHVKSLIIICLRSIVAQKPSLLQLETLVFPLQWIN